MGDLKTDPEHMKVMNDVDRRGCLIIGCSTGRKHKSMNVEESSHLVQTCPHGKKKLSIQ